MHFSFGILIQWIINDFSFSHLNNEYEFKKRKKIGHNSPLPRFRIKNRKKKKTSVIEFDAEEKKL